VLTVVATVDPTMRTVTSQRNTRGPVSSRSSQSGDGNDVVDEQTEPNTVAESRVDPAGEVSKVSITVALDSAHVNAQQQLAVSRLLSSYTDPRRKDPTPTVTRFAFRNGTGDTPKNSDFEEIAKASKEQSTTKSSSGSTIQRVPETPKPMLLFMNLMFQQTVIPRPKEATPEGAGFVPRHFEENYNH